MRRGVGRPAAGVATLWALLAAVSAQADGPAICTVRVRSAELIVLICSRDAGDQVWRARSQVACAAQSRCNVWIWEDPAKAPEVAPASDTQIVPSQSDSAVAVWINESQTLVKLRGRR